MTHTRRKDPSAPHMIYSDAAFAILLLLLCVFYIFKAPKGIGVCDEWSFIVSANRMLRGDMPIVSDWTPVTLSCIFLIPPVKIFTLLTGSLNGIVLFLRYFYVAFHTVFSLIIYLRLRKYRWFSVFAAINYMCFIPNEIYSLYYNSISLMATAAIGLLLFSGKRPGKKALTASGILFSCSVLALPHTALIYLVYTVTVFIGHFLSGRKSENSRFPMYAGITGWFYITIGIAVCALLFFITLLLSVTPRELLSAIPHFLEFAGHTVNKALDPARIREALKMSGYIPPVAAAVLLIMIAADRNRQKRKLLYIILLAVNTAAFYAALYAYYFDPNVIRTNFIAVTMRSVPFYIVGAAAFLLTEKRNREMFIFLLYGLCFSLIRDVSSNITIGLGGAASDIAAAILLHDLYRECLPEAISSRGKKRLVAVLCVLPVLFASASELTWKIAGRNFCLVETPVLMQKDAPGYTITDGPMRGIRTNMYASSVCGRLTQDMNSIKQHSPSSLYIAGRFQFCYLFPGFDCAADSAVFNDGEMPYQLSYWELYPEKRPGCIYIPLYDCESFMSVKENADALLEFFGSICRFDFENGKAGYILYNINWDR